MPRYRVDKTTINLGASAALDKLQDALCLLGTRGCIAGTTYCRFPTLDGCCGAVWSNPGGGGNLTRDCGVSIPTGCGRLSPITTTIPTDGCGRNFSTCPGRSVWDVDDLINTVEALDEARDELRKAAEEIEESLPELREALEPPSMTELEAAEVELRTALDRVRQLRERAGER